MSDAKHTFDLTTFVAERLKDAAHDLEYLANMDLSAEETAEVDEGIKALNLAMSHYRHTHGPKPPQS